MYRWHACLSQDDEKWLGLVFRQLFARKTTSADGGGGANGNGGAGNEGKGMPHSVSISF